MTRCSTCDSYYPNPRCPACQPRIEENEEETETENEHETMNTHDHEPVQVREYIPMRQNKTAAEIQREINLMRLAYAYRMNVNQPRRDRMVGWCLLAIMAAISTTVILAVFLA